MPAISTPFLKEFLLVTMSLNFVVGMITSFRKGGVDGHAKGFLAVFYWACLGTLFVSYIFLFTDGHAFIHLFRTMPLAMCLVLPAAYLYVRQTLEQRRLKASDLLHLSMASVYLVDMLPFFMKPASEKLAMLQHMSLASLGIQYSEGWFMPDYGHVILRYLVSAVYLVLMCRLSLRMEQRHREGTLSLNRPQRNWIRIFVFSQFLLIVSPLVFIVNRSPLYVLLAMVSTGMVMLVIQMYYLLRHPEVLYGDGFGKVFGDAERAGSTTVRMVEKKQPEKLVEANEEMDTALEDLMVKTKPYLRAGYKLRDLADDTGFSMARLSVHINKHHGTNFSGYLNELRIEHAIAKMRDNEHRMKTLEAIAEESGFQNRITFIRAFKKFKGMIPSRFLETHCLEGE